MRADDAYFDVHTLGIPKRRSVWIHCVNSNRSWQVLGIIDVLLRLPSPNIIERLLQLYCLQLS